jgi:hypothetical protein
MLAVFSLGASFVPVEIAANLLLSYVVFLYVFGIVMAYGLIGIGGARYRDALAVGDLAHRRTIAEWRRTTGGDPPRSPAEAEAWLAANPVADYVDDARVLRVEIVAWSLLMAIASGLIGVALLVGRLTGVWR